MKKNDNIKTKLFETDVIMVPPSDEEGPKHLFTLGQLAAIYEVVRPLMSAEEFDKFNEMSGEDQEKYLSGFGANILEWLKAKYDANKAAQEKDDDDQQGGNGQQPSDGLDHWKPVKKSKKEQSSDNNDNSNKVYPDLEQELEDSEQNTEDAAQDSKDTQNQMDKQNSNNMQNQNNSNSNASSSQNVQDAANSMMDSAQKIQDAAQKAADIAQKAADMADNNAQQSGDSKDIQNADKSQVSADAAQDMANQATEAAQNAKDLLNEAKEAAQNGNLEEAQAKLNQAADEIQKAANKSKAAQLNARDAIQSSKETDQNSQGGQGSQQSQNQQNQSGNQNQSGQQGQQSGQQSGQQGQQSGGQGQSGQQGQMSVNQNQSGEQSGQQTGQQSGQYGSQQSGQQGQPGNSNSFEDSEDNYPDPELEKVNDKYDPNKEITHQKPIGMDMRFNGNDFVGNDQDLIEKCRKMAEEAGQPLDSDDLVDPGTYASKKFNEARQALKKWKPTTPGTDGNPPNITEEIISKLFATKIDWRNKLSKFMNAKALENKIDVMAKRRMGVDPGHPFYRGRYLRPNTELEEKRSTIAQVFILIDASGSMAATCGDGRNIFEHIMSELIQIEINVKIKRTAFAAFAHNPIYRKDIITWTYEDAMDKKALMKKFKMPEAGGGTSAIEAIRSIQRYDEYYSVNDPETLLIVVTDGFDNYIGLKDICKRRSQINNMVWIITSEEQYFDQKIKELEEQGLPKSHIICIDVVEDWGADVKFK